MNDPKSLSATLKDALAKKHAAQHPDAKTNNTGSKKANTSNAPKGPPQRRASSRGG